MIILVTLFDQRSRIPLNGGPTYRSHRDNNLCGFRRVFCLLAVVEDVCRSFNL